MCRKSESACCNIPRTGTLSSYERKIAFEQAKMRSRTSPTPIRQGRQQKTIHPDGKLPAPLQAVPCAQRRQSVSLFPHGYGERQKWTNSFSRKRPQRNMGSHPPACGSTSTRWNLPILSGSIPGSRRTNQTDKSFVRGGNCRHRPFVRVPSWLYVVNLSRMEPG